MANGNGSSSGFTSVADVITPQVYGQYTDAPMTEMSSMLKLANANSKNMHQRAIGKHAKSVKAYLKKTRRARRGR
jgi:hypothetical protein